MSWPKITKKIGGAYFCFKMQMEKLIVIVILGTGMQIIVNSSRAGVRETCTSILEHIRDNNFSDFIQTNKTSVY